MNALSGHGFTAMGSEKKEAVLNKSGPKRVSSGEILPNKSCHDTDLFVVSVIKTKELAKKVNPHS